MVKEHYTRLKDLREDYDLSQAQVAEHHGWHITTYTRWEQGKVDCPAWAIKQLTYFYNISADYLLGITNEPLPLPQKNRWKR